MKTPTTAAPVAHNGPVYCSHCGTANVPGSRFCSNCNGMLNPEGG